ncbi:SDR family oxidoreductase [Pseudochryseolinea flava]|uniref:3-beta hydroxysteroid dehydrogenase n=1 Tax=Pseudochryseolinea flava TaxID=2059302 RepID=A0A364Y6H1_9BACT|nr:SDR family oxidoreductase [Pseudochryseolinea flava]RAW02567.1 3-beta hydroxysteroid dehydrogenase [Pseudochryseolinea flava]
MKVFVTGASGFIGSAVVKELRDAKHEVIGLARTEASAKKITDSGAAVLMGGLEDLDVLKQGALLADGIIHTAFIHDFTQYVKANEVEKEVINAMAGVLVGTNKPLIVTAGILGLPLMDGNITEDSKAVNAPRSSEGTAMKWAQEGVNVSVVRLPPSVHDKGDNGFIPFMIRQARKYNIAAYPGVGENRWGAVHRLDAAKLFRLALEHPTKGALYNAIGDNGITLREIANIIGDSLGVSVGSVSGDDSLKHFDWMSRFINIDGPATSLKTQQVLGWKPEHMGLVEDMRKNYF